MDGSYMPTGHPARGYRRFKTKVEREKGLAVVEEMHLRGCRLRDIAVQVKVRLAMAWKMDKKLERRYQVRQQTTREEGVAVAVARLEEVIRVAWIAYERSSADAEQLIEELRPLTDEEVEGTKDRVVKINGKKVKLKGRVRAGTVAESMKLLKRIVQRKGRLPSDAYLRLVKETVVEICRLKGWVTEININVGGPVAAPGWEPIPDDGYDPNVIDVKAIEGPKK